MAATTPTPEPKSWAELWQEATQTRTCAICDVSGSGHHFITCCECDDAFHKVCLDPLRSTPWTQEDSERFVCSICDCYCRVCEADDDEDLLLMCDYCNEGYHTYCLDPPLDDVPDEDEDWLCVHCEAEMGSDDDGCDGGDDEPFTRSGCDCEVCASMNDANDTWADFVPQTGMQFHLKRAIDSREGLVNHLTDEANFGQ